MKKTLFLGLTLIWFNQVLNAQTLSVKPCLEKPKYSDQHSKGEAIQKSLDKLINLSVPGAVAAVWDEEGYWEYSNGFAQLENQIHMDPCHLHYLQSIAKTYLATAVMQLYEADKIDLNASINAYLPKQFSDQLSNSENITVKMLLNHTSGLREYNSAPKYVTRLLQNPTRVFEPEEYLEYVAGKNQDFEPGSRYAYRNMNYLILAMITDFVTGDHVRYLEENIFQPLGMMNTHYRIAQEDTFGDKLVNSYWDRYSDGILENVSILQNSNVASMVGDDGIITNAYEGILFLKGLMEGKLVSSVSLEMMQEWVLNSRGNPAYGLGLTRAIFAGEIAIGHDGGGLGAGAQLYYFPKLKTYMFLAMNLGTVTDSPIHKEAGKIIEEIHIGFVK